MDESKFDLGEVIQFGWDSMVGNFWFFFLILILAGLVEAVPAGLQSIGYQYPWLAAVLGVIFLIFALILSMGFIRVTLRICDGEKPSASDLFVDWEKLFNYFIASILYGLMVAVGLVLLVIPGIWLGVKFMFYGYAIVDEGLGPIEALKKSARETKGAWWLLFLLLVICLGIWIVGFCACLVGLFFAVPVILMALASTYRSLLRYTEFGSTHLPAPDAADLTPPLA